MSKRTVSYLIKECLKCNYSNGFSSLNRYHFGGDQFWACGVVDPEKIPTLSGCYGKEVYGKGATPEEALENLLKILKKYYNII